MSQRLAVRIGVQVGLGRGGVLPFLSCPGPDDAGSASLTERPAKPWIPSSKATRVGQMGSAAYAYMLTEAEVVLAERQRGVDEAGAFVGGDEVGRNHAPRREGARAEQR